jgi:hypothetical protein
MDDDTYTPSVTLRGFTNNQKLLCDSHVCDGRPARWLVECFGTQGMPVAVLPRSCSVHLARICELVSAVSDSPETFEARYKTLLEETGARKENTGRKRR